MSIDSKIAELILNEVSRINLNQLQSFVKENYETIKHFYDNNLLKDDLLDKSINDSIIKTAKSDYEYLIRKKPISTYADHLVYPEFLAYGLNKKVFSDKEISKIPFDHGDNAISFQESYGKKNLVESIKKELLSPPKKFDYKIPDSHCYCGI